MPQGIAARVGLERLTVFARVFERFADGKAQVHAFVFREVRACQLRAHRVKILWSEPESLEVGEAPVSGAALRRQRDALAIRVDAFLLPSGCLQRVAVVEPDFLL